MINTMIPIMAESLPKRAAAPHRRCVSDPLFQLLQAAGITPAKIFASLERQLWIYGEARLRSGHPYVRRLRQSSGLHIVGIYRAHRHLLVDIDQVHSAVRWRYREYSRNNCEFACTANIPETAKLALVGRKLETLIMPHPCLIAPVIAEIADSGMGLSVTVNPAWHVF